MNIFNKNCARGKCREKNIKSVPSVPFLFELYANFKIPDPNSESPASIDLESINSWLEKAGILSEANGVRGADVFDAFSTVSEGKTCLNMKEFNEFLVTLAYNKKKNTSQFVKALSTAGPPTGIDPDALTKIDIPPTAAVTIILEKKDTDGADFASEYAGKPDMKELEKMEKYFIDNSK
ncbi:hypothetical protein CDAR_441381 [Caerostris darwini]|uniref:Uncharacterized protein n=1 Tax=Caerostris darwini TaxID=1538125 RepID=A0AAV4TQX9_9ARAC|nr:hypothetical protein CDAR_441381 [Caerostris darwini]